MEIEVGTVLKLEVNDKDLVFYQISSVHQSSYSIKPLCRIRKDYLTIRYDIAERHIYKSEVGVYYLAATKREMDRIREILDEFLEVVLEHR